MTGIEDKIVVRFLVPRGPEFYQIIQRAGNLVEHPLPVEKHAPAGFIIERTVILNRPDSLDEGIIGSYIYQARDLASNLNEICVSSPKLDIAKFNFPAPLTPPAAA